MEQEIIQPIDKQVLKSELTPERQLRMTNKSHNEIYVITAHEAPNVMREIGRLREIAFRTAGGGTGRDVDIDEFDTCANCYKQLIVWNPEAEEIIGGYRYLLGTDWEIMSNGQPHLATSHMFHFSDKFLNEYMPQTIELGRSFVAVEYQSSRMGSKSLFALDNLWDGLGALTVIMPDARYADKVVILTDDLVQYPNTPNAISEHDVDFVVEVDSVGDSSKIASGAIRDTKNPRDILLAKQAAKVIINSGYFRNGFSIQTGSGGASLAAVKYIRESMIEQGITASFALGGITAHMVKMHEEGLIDRLIDVQSFDKVAAESLMSDPMHKEVSASEYASADTPGSATHYLDIVILSALEVDVNFNVNVLVGSDGIIRGAVGGHPDTAADSALSIIVCPLLRGRIPCVVDQVTTLITPGRTIDVVVTEYGIAVNPARPEIAERLKAAGLKLVTLEELRDRALKVIGQPDPLPFGDKVVGVVMNRDGSVMDVIKNIQE